MMVMMLAVVATEGEGERQGRGVVSQPIVALSRFVDKVASLGPKLWKILVFGPYMQIGNFLNSIYNFYKTTRTNFAILSKWWDNLHLKCQNLKCSTLNDIVG